jgi:hypothetical protein
MIHWSVGDDINTVDMITADDEKFDDFAASELEKQKVPRNIIK